MNQRKFNLLELISECGLEGAKLVQTPLEIHEKFNTVEYDEHFGTDEDMKLQEINTLERAKLEVHNHRCLQNHLELLL